MQVTEIFLSIQGESTYAGLPCIFVRLTGCNLRCVWCDTAYAFHGGKKMTVSEVLSAVHDLSDQNGRRRVDLVELTGGEPLLQVEIYPLLDSLIENGYRVLIETSGERDIGQLPESVVRIVDVKCPGSGEGDTFHAGNLCKLSLNDQLKFVLSNRQDYDYASLFLDKYNATEIVGTVIFSPVFGQLEPRLLAQWILDDGLPVRMGMQLHKLIWDPQEHGV